MENNLLELNITHFDKITIAKSAKATTLQNFLTDVQECKYQYLIDKLINIPEGRQQDWKVKKLPAIKVAGIFRGLADSKFSGVHTNLVIVDIDHVTDIDEFKTKIVSDDFTTFAFISPRRDGLKIGIKISTIQTDSSWESYRDSIVAYYNDKYKIVVDAGRLCLNANCFYSCDPDVYINTESEVFEYKAKSLRSRVEKKAKTIIESESNTTPETPTKILKASTGFDLSETFRRMEAMHNGNFHDECVKIGNFIGAKVRSGHIKIDDEELLIDKMSEILRKNVKAKDGEGFQDILDRIDDHFKTFKQSIEWAKKDSDDNDKVSKDQSNLVFYNGNKQHINAECWKEIIKAAPYYVLGKGINEKIMKRRGHFLQLSSVSDKPNLLAEVIGREYLQKDAWEVLKKNEKAYCHCPVYTGKIQNADWIERMPRMENVYWFDNQIVKLTKDGYEPVKKYVEVFGDDNPELAANFEFQHHDILGIRDPEHISGNYLLKNKGKLVIEERYDDVILLPGLIEFIIDICKESVDGVWVRNIDREEDVKFLMGKYITTSRGDDKDKMLWICDENPMNSGRTGKSLLAKLITLIQQTSYRDGRSFGEKADVKFAFANFNPAIHNIIFLDEWMSDISPIYSWTTGECVTQERKFVNLQNLDKKQTPNLVATSNTMPKDFRKSSNRGRIDFIVVSNYIKAQNFDKGIEYKKTNKLMQWEVNAPEWNTLFNDLLTLGKNYLKNPSRKLKYDPMASMELLRKELGVPDSFCRFVKEIDEYVDGLRNALISRDNFNPKTARKYMKIFKGKEMDALYMKFCRRNDIDAIHPDYISEDILTKIMKISKYVWVQPIKTAKINTFGVLKSEIKK